MELELALDLQSLLFRMVITLKNILQAPLAELLGLKLSPLANLKSDETYYLDVLIAYLRGDAKELKELCDLRPEKSNIFNLLAQMRLAILSHNLQVSDLKIFEENILSLKPNEMLLGESYFVLAYGAYTIHESAYNVIYSEKALSYLNHGQLKKKAVKAAHNLLVAKSTIETNKNFIADYSALYLQARKVRDRITCGLCLLNISREYQKYNLLQAALDYVNKSIIYFSADAGVNHYYLSLVHRAHIYAQMKMTTSALTDIEKASACDFSEVKSAIDVVEQLLDQKSKIEIVPTLNPTWRERAIHNKKECLRNRDFSELEEKLVSHLKSSPRDKFSLISHLYGDQINFSSAENRLKNLLLRIRKKNPHLIYYKNSLYCLTEESGLRAYA